MKGLSLSLVMVSLYFSDDQIKFIRSEFAEDPSNTAQLDRLEGMRPKLHYAAQLNTGLVFGMLLTLVVSFAFNGKDLRKSIFVK